MSKDLPVRVTHRGGHSAFYSARAFAMAGIARDTPKPARGPFGHDARGELTGRVTDNARALIGQVGTLRTYAPAGATGYEA